MERSWALNSLFTQAWSSFPWETTLGFSRISAIYSETSLEQKWQVCTAASSSAPTWSHHKVLCFPIPFPTSLQTVTSEHLWAKFHLRDTTGFETEKDRQTSKCKLKALAQKTPLISQQFLTSQHLAFLKYTSTIVLGLLTSTSNSTTDLGFITWLQFSTHRVRILWEGFASASIRFQLLQPQTAGKQNGIAALTVVNLLHTQELPGYCCTMNFMIWQQMELGPTVCPLVLNSMAWSTTCHANTISCHKPVTGSTALSFQRRLWSCTHPAKQKPDMAHTERWKGRHKYQTQLGTHFQELGWSGTICRLQQSHHLYPSTGKTDWSSWSLLQHWHPWMWSSRRAEKDRWENIGS